MSFFDTDGTVLKEYTVETIINEFDQAIEVFAKGTVYDRESPTWRFLAVLEDSDSKKGGWTKEEMTPLGEALYLQFVGKIRSYIPWEFKKGLGLYIAMYGSSLKDLNGVILKAETPEELAEKVSRQCQYLKIQLMLDIAMQS